MVHSQGEVVYGEDGNPVRIAGTFQDITERKKMEEEQRNLQAQVQHAQKLESLGVLAGGIAHDFNNLLAAMLGYASLADQELSEGSPAKSHILEVIKAAQRAADLTKQMLAYSGRGAFVLHPVHISECCEEMAKLLEVVISKNVTLSRQLERELPLIEADKGQISQIVMNLITNASEAMGDAPGVIALRTGIVDADEKYLAATYLNEGLPAGPYVFIEVSDTGIGMGEETIAKMFDPFYTTKFTGRGLGMAAVLGIVRGHRGAIKVESKIGHGTSVRVLLPSDPDAEKVPYTSSKDIETPAEVPANGGGRTILVVDDEEMVRALAKQVLERAGFSVLLAADGGEGIEVFRQKSDEISVVLLDLTMPDTTGDKVFLEMKQVRPDVSVILSSGFNEQEAMQRLDGNAPPSFIQKPYDSAALIRKIYETIDLAASEQG